MNQFLIIRCHIDHIMESHICLCYFCDVFTSVQNFFKILSGLFQFFQLFLSDFLTCELHCQFFQCFSDFQHISQAFLRNVRHFRTFSRNHNDQTFQLQLTDCLTDRGTAHAQFICKLDFHQSFTRFKLSSKDCLSECIEYHIPERKVFIFIDFQILLHAFYFLLAWCILVTYTCFASFCSFIFCAARLADCLSSNKPNTVGPLPLIIAFMAPPSFMTFLICSMTG